MKSYYQRLKDNGDTERISRIEKVLNATRLPKTLIEKVFDFLHWGGYSDSIALDEISIK